MRFTCTVPVLPAMPWGISYLRAVPRLPVITLRMLLCKNRMISGETSKGGNNAVSGWEFWLVRLGVIADLPFRNSGRHQGELQWRCQNKPLTNTRNHGLARCPDNTSLCKLPVTVWNNPFFFTDQPQLADIS